MSSDPVVYFAHRGTMQNVLARMAEEMAAALDGTGLEGRLFDPAGPSLATFAADFNAGRVAGLVSVNMYNALPPEVLAVWNACGLPAFFYCTDHPYLGWEGYRQVLDTWRNPLFSMTGEDEVALAGRLFGQPERFQVLRQGAVPHAEAPWQGRDIDHLVIGNNPIPVWFPGIHDPEAFRNTWPLLGGPVTSARLNRMVEDNRADPRKPLADLVDDAVGDEPVELAEKIRLGKILGLYLCAHVRAWALHVLLQTDTVVAGMGWEYLEVPNRRGRLIGGVDSRETMALTARARRLYNLSPAMFSCSERLLEAVALGTPVVTNRSAFLQRTFGDCLSTFDTLDELVAIVTACEPEDVVRERVARARRIFLAGHTWAHRARVIAETLRTVPPARG
ncbi:MAG: glycosyltransferase [Actinomycetota bacterium]